MYTNSTRQLPNKLRSQNNILKMQYTWTKFFK